MRKSRLWYYRLHKPDEYTSSFSHINVRILVWGCVLLVLMHFLAPLHGWGEYSYFRGSINMQLGFKAFLPANPTCFPENVSEYITSITQNTSIYIQNTYNAELRSHLYHAASGDYFLTLRLHSKAEAVRLFEDIQCLRLIQELSAIALAERYRGGVVHLWEVAKNASVFAMIDREQFQTYVAEMLEYQDCNTCGFDFTPINNHVTSFLIYSLVLLLALPAFTSAVFYGSTIYYSYCSVVETYVSTAHSIHVKAVRDKTLSHVYALTAFCTFCIHAAYFAINIKAANGAFYSRKIYLSTNVLIYGEPILLPFCYVLIHVLKVAWLICKGRGGVRSIFGSKDRRTISKNCESNGIELETFLAVDDHTTKSI